MDRIIKRGDIYYANLNPVIGSEQGGTRPVLIISNDTGNKHSPTVIVAAITGQIGPYGHCRGDYRTDWNKEKTTDTHYRTQCQWT
ncbi:toxin-antitoxin system toxin component MazF family [Eubacterium sp. CAG:603]|nr:toxin-antitoxin system toxin component MazF family [Eubacterium sp. CAG:603]